ncbi:MAG: DnaJ domain-containing protein [Deltaproteobacteria bacterium]|nr:DnaJ domain-containing protein [Deltaproteobacteria bacterium]
MTAATRPTPTAEGRFARTPLAHLLVYIREHALSGSLAIEGPSIGNLAGEHLFVFEDGQLTAAHVATGLARFGELAVQLQWLASSELLDAEAMLTAAPQPIGALLTEMGVLTDAQVQTLLHMQCVARIKAMFALGNAIYRFYDAVDLLPSVHHARPVVELLAIVWEGIEAAPPHAAMSQALAKLGTAEASLRPGAPLAAYGFDAAHEQLVDALRLGPATLATLEGLVTDREIAQRFVYALLIGKCLDVHGAHPDPTPVPVAQTTPANPTPKPTVPAADAPSASDQALLDKARERLNALDRENFFQMLEVATDADADAVRHAFMRKAAEWHPDRVRSEQVKSAFQSIFSLLNEAQRVLLDPQSRDRYARIAKDGGGTPESQRKVDAMLEAATLAQKAEILLRRHDLDEAERSARQAHALNAEDPAVLAALGAVLVARGGDGPLVEAIKVLTEATVLSPKNDRAQLALGQALQRRGELAKAQKHFALALEANPKNIDAAREIRLTELRSRGGPDRPASKEAKPSTEPESPGALAAFSRWLNKK